MNCPARMEGPACQVRFLEDGLSFSSPCWRARQACPSEWFPGGTCLSGLFPREWIIDFVSVLAGTTSVPLRGSMDGVKGVAPMCAACNRGGELVGAIHELPLPRRCLELVSMFWGEPWIARTVEVLFSTKSGDESSAFFNRCSALRWARREMVQVPRVTVGGAGSRSPIRRPNRRRAQHYRPSVPSRQ